VTSSEPARATASLPEPEKLKDSNRVPVRLTTEQKAWFGIISNHEHRTEAQQGRMVLGEFIERWKGEHPEVAAKYLPLVAAAVREEAGQ
jgi:hypothetical protein